MSSTIGNYIHLSWQGYIKKDKFLKHGTKYSEASIAAELQKKRNDQLAKTAKTLTVPQLKKLENSANKMLEMVKNKKIVAEDKRILDEIANEIVVRANEKGSELVVNANRMGVYNKDKNALAHGKDMVDKYLGGGKNEKGEKIKKNYFRIKDNQSKFKKMIKDIENTILEMDEAELTNGTLTKKYKSIIGELKNILKDAENTLQNGTGTTHPVLEKHGKEIWVMINKLESQSISGEKANNNNNILGELESLLRDISTVSAAYYAGEYAELWLTEFFSDNFESIKEAATGVMASLFGGGASAQKTGGSAYNEVNVYDLGRMGIGSGGDSWRGGDIAARIMGVVDKNGKAKVTHKRFANDGYAEIKSVQRKADITLMLPNEEEPVGITVKNYALGKDAQRADIKLVSGSPLLYLLQTEEPSFVNHFLNLNIKHPAMPNSKTLVEYKMQESKMFNEIVNLTLAIKGLTGSGLLKKDDNGDIASKTDAGVMVLNDSSTGTIYMRRTIDIINKLKSNPSWITSENVPNLSAGDALAGYLASDFDYPNERIADILAKMHQRKISVHIDSNAITDNSK